MGVVQTWLSGDGLVDATCVRGDSSGWTLLTIAAGHGRKRLVQLLLKRRGARSRTRKTATALQRCGRRPATCRWLRRC